MSGPGERGQRDGGVHHSQVSEKLLRRADEGDEEDKISMGGVGGLFCICLVIGYQPKVHHSLGTFSDRVICVLRCH